jgi:hypothetical protein
MYKRQPIAQRNFLDIILFWLKFHKVRLYGLVLPSHTAWFVGLAVWVWLSAYSPSSA